MSIVCRGQPWISGGEAICELKESIFSGGLGWEPEGGNKPSVLLPPPPLLFSLFY